MALSRLSRLTRHAFKVTQRYSSKRHKTYLVGVDGSDFGFTALRSIAKSSERTDKIISMYFPTNIALFMEQSEAMQLSTGQVDTMRDDLVAAQNNHNKEIEEKCDKIVEQYAPKNIVAYCKIGEPTFSPKDELIKSCYNKKADCLVVGAKGISHSLREKVSDSVQRIGNVADFAVHNAPCDVLIIKSEHEY
eukprot:158457_1